MSVRRSGDEGDSGLAAGWTALGIEGLSGGLGRARSVLRRFALGLGVAVGLLVTSAQAVSITPSGGSGNQGGQASVMFTFALGSSLLVEAADLSVAFNPLALSLDLAGSTAGGIPLGELESIDGMVVNASSGQFALSYAPLDPAQLSGNGLLKLVFGILKNAPTGDSPVDISGFLVEDEFSATANVNIRRAPVVPVSEPSSFALLALVAGAALAYRRRWHRGNR